MKHIASRLALAAVLALGSTVATHAQTSRTPEGAATDPASPKSGAARSTLSRADANFMRDAARAGMAEVEGSQLAVDKASNAQVKSFARKMVDDHTKAGQELSALASSKGVDLPKDASVTQKAKMKLLSTADGSTFDKRYADSLGVKAHQDTVKLFQKASTSAQDADVKAFATKTLPTLQEHLQMAQQMQAAVQGMP